MNINRSYVHEAVMKVKTHDFSSESNVTTAILLDQTPSDACDVRASRGVKIRAKLSINQSTKHQNREQK